MRADIEVRIKPRGNRKYLLLGYITGVTFTNPIDTYYDPLYGEHFIRKGVGISGQMRVKFQSKFLPTMEKLLAKRVPITIRFAFGRQRHEWMSYAVEISPWSNTSRSFAGEFYLFEKIKQKRKRRKK